MGRQRSLFEDLLHAAKPLIEKCATALSFHLARKHLSGWLMKTPMLNLKKSHSPGFIRMSRMNRLGTHRLSRYMRSISRDGARWLSGFDSRPHAGNPSISILSSRLAGLIVISPADSRTMQRSALVLRSPTYYSTSGVTRFLYVTQLSEIGVRRVFTGHRACVNMFNWPTQVWNSIITPG